MKFGQNIDFNKGKINMNKKNDKRKDEIIALLHEINTKLKSVPLEYPAKLISDGKGIELTTYGMNDLELKGLMGVIADWNDQRNANSMKNLGALKQEAETELKDYL